MRMIGKVVALAAVAVGALACSSPGDAPAAATTAPAAASASPSAPVALRTCTADDVAVGGAPGSKPTITIPDSCTPPAQLLTKDLVTGTGPELNDGGSMQAHYDLVTWSDKQELDSSWSRGAPFPLENVGHASVIDGWNEGLLGMKQGGRRLLVVPPDKGYGAGGHGIKPGETLVFVVDAVQVTA
jgi:peptidylprolyl isomerase